MIVLSRERKEADSDTEQTSQKSGRPFKHNAGKQMPKSILEYEDMGRPFAQQQRVNKPDRYGLSCLRHIKLSGLSPPANYTDQATAACRRS
jgi:hypothetical protein